MSFEELMQKFFELEARVAFLEAQLGPVPAADQDSAGKEGTE